MPQSENRLRRETPYVCNVRFHADLPEVGSGGWLPPAVWARPGTRLTALECLQVPCDPKMLIAPLQPEKLAQFSLTTLERNPRRELVQDADLGIHISLLDIERYSVPDTAPPLAPEDAALLAVCPEPVVLPLCTATPEPLRVAAVSHLLFCRTT